MLTPNETIYRQAIDALNERGIDAYLEFLDDDAMAYDPDRPDGTVRGKAAIGAFIEVVIGDFDEFHVAIEELVRSGDRVVGMIRMYGRGADGMELEIRDAHTLTFRDGKIVYWRAYTTKDEALADIGHPDADPAQTRSP